MILDSLENKRKILANFLEICRFEGFNDHALSLAFTKSELDPKFRNLLFEKGVLSVVEFYIDQQILQLQAQIAKKSDFAALKIREKIKFTLYKLFENEAKNRLALERLQAFYFDVKNFTNVKNGPKPLFMAFKHATKIADAMWNLIGDKSTDFNYYSKRAVLAKIILQSFRVFIKDNSPNLQKTKENIDLQIEKVMQFEKFKVKIKTIKNDLKEKSKEIFMDEFGNPKTVKQIIKDLPFIRLFN